jgi:hypothetical protein
MSGDVFVRLHNGFGIITEREPFSEDAVYNEAFRKYSEQFAAAPVDLTMYGTLATLGGLLGIQSKQENQE